MFFFLQHSVLVWRSITTSSQTLEQGVLVGARGATVLISSVHGAGYVLRGAQAGVVAEYCGGRCCD